MKIKISSKIISVILIIACIAAFGTYGASAAQVDDSSASMTDAAEDSADEENEEDSSDAESRLPSYYSSADLGYVTEVEEQGLNDCWSYAGLSTFESKLLHDGIFTDSFSKLLLNLWATTKTNGKGWQRTINGAGYACIVPGYLTSWYGAVEESVAEQFDIDNMTADDVVSGYAKYGVTELKYLNENDTDEIKQSIIDNGGVYVGFAHTDSCLTDNIYYYMPDSYSGRYTGHAVEIVGWDDDLSKDNFTRCGQLPSGDGAWLVKNSWGSDYNSIGGYLWISYYDKYFLNSLYAPTYTIQGYEEITDDLKLVQNEIYGATYSFEYLFGEDNTYVNKFDFSQGYDTVDKIVFETTSVGAEYTLYYVPVDEKTLLPTADESSWTELYGSTVDYAGYICADIEDFELSGRYGAIAVNIDTTAVNKNKSPEDESYIVNNVGVCEWLSGEDGDYIFRNESEYGDSYVLNNRDGESELIDVLDYYSMMGDDIGGTLVIKAITRKTKDALIGDVNYDGVISILDVTSIQKYLAEIEEFSSGQLERANFNSDEEISILDATEIQKYIAGIV